MSNEERKQYLKQQLQVTKELITSLQDELKVLDPPPPAPYVYCFVDVESTGLNAKRHQVIEIAMTRCTADLSIVEEFDTKIAMWPGSRKRAEPIALKVNGYTDTEWSDAPYPNREIYERVARLSNNAIMCSQNIEFDKEFLSQSMNHYGIDASWQRRCVDIQSYSGIIGEFFNLKSWGLGEVYEALNGPELPMHRARPDVQKAMFIYAFARKMLLRGLETREYEPQGETSPVVAATTMIRCTNPDHEDKNPSMRVNVHTGEAKCFSCGMDTTFTPDELLKEMNKGF